LTAAAFAVPTALWYSFTAHRTEFMEAAAAHGLRVFDGVAMISHQMPRQTAFWRGQT
jgi:shikimate 5-dehydrogenase